MKRELVHQVLWNRLIAVVEEQANVLLKTAFGALENVRNAVLDALMNDQSPDVRSTAISMLEPRFADGDYERLPAMAAELVALALQIGQLTVSHCDKGLQLRFRAVLLIDQQPLADFLKRETETPPALPRHAPARIPREIQGARARALPRGERTRSRARRTRPAGSGMPHTAPATSSSCSVTFGVVAAKLAVPSMLTMPVLLEPPM